MNVARSIIYLFVNKLFRVFGFRCIFRSSQGIKYFNSQFSSDIFFNQKPKKQFFVLPKDLLMPFDGLIDEVTLLDVPISESPHSTFMMALQNKQNLSKTEYYKRCLNGTIDMRFNHILNTKKIIDLFERKLQQIISDTYSPVIITVIDGKKYILDGKHKAALCCIIGKKVRCVEINHPYHDSFFYQINLKIQNSKSNFTKSTSFFASIYSE